MSSKPSQSNCDKFDRFHRSVFENKGRKTPLYHGNCKILDIGALSKSKAEVNLPLQKGNWISRTNPFVHTEVVMMCIKEACCDRSDITLGPLDKIFLVFQVCWCKLRTCRGGLTADVEVWYSGTHPGFRGLCTWKLCMGKIRFRWSPTFWIFAKLATKL